MAVDETPDPLARATQALRADDEDGWAEVSRTILDRVRTLVAPAESMTSFDADGRSERGTRGSTIKVSSRVVTPTLRDALESPARAADAIEVVVEDGRCTAVHVDLVALFGTDLQHEGQEVRLAVAEVLATLLGPDPAFDAARDITVRVTDVVEDGPHHQ